MGMASGLRATLDRKLLKAAEMLYAPAYDFGIEYVETEKDGSVWNKSFPIPCRKNSMLKTVLDAKTLNSVLNAYEIFMGRKDASDPKIFVYLNHGSSEDLQSRLVKIYQLTSSRRGTLDESMLRIESDVTNQMKMIDSLIEDANSYSEKFQPIEEPDMNNIHEIADYAERVLNSQIIDTNSLVSKRMELDSYLKKKRAEYGLITLEYKKTMRAIDEVRKAISSGRVVDMSLISAEK